MNNSKKYELGDYIVHTRKPIKADRFDIRIALGFLAVIMFVIGYFYLLDNKLKEIGNNHVESGPQSHYTGAENNFENEELSNFTKPTQIIIDYK